MSVAHNLVDARPRPVILARQLRNGYDAATVPIPSYTVSEWEVLAWLYPAAGIWLTWAKRDRNAEIIRRYRAGESTIALAQEFGVSDRRIRRIIQRYR